jgi:menaquinone-9 beta-reductase
MQRQQRIQTDSYGSGKKEQDSSRFHPSESVVDSLDEAEVFIAGGGPAGLAAAIAARMAGFDVMVADPARPPIDKACGEGVLPEGVAALARMGVAVGAHNAVPFRGIRFLQPGSSASADFPDGIGFGVRRTTLHNLLVERAASVGVSMRWGTRVTGITGDGVLVDGENVRCRWVVGADGQNSQVRCWAGLDAAATQQRFGFRRHFEVEPWSEYVDVHWSEFGQIYVSPVSAREVCIAFLTRHRQLRFKDVFALFPEVAWRLTRAKTSEQGAVTPMRKLNSVCRDQFVLVGEASGSVDAITGTGLSMAFQQALSLADALSRNDLRAYERSHRHIRRMPGIMAGLMLVMDQHPKLRSRVLRAFSTSPALFERMLAVHSGSLLYRTNSLHAH